MTEMNIFAWKLIRNLLLAIGISTIVFAISLLKLYPYASEINRWIFSIGLAIISFSIASHSIVNSKESDKKMADIEEKNYINKIIRFKEENRSNVKLTDYLITAKDHYLPQHILDEKMKIVEEDKDKKLNPGEVPRYLQYTLDEMKEIVNGGMWIPKDEFSYEYALQVIDLSHYAINEEFVKKIKEYIDVGKQLNVQKSFCQTWILARPSELPNPSEAHSYYDRLDTAKRICEKMTKIINDELKEHNENY